MRAASPGPRYSQPIESDGADEIDDAVKAGLAAVPRDVVRDRVNSDAAAVRSLPQKPWEVIASEYPPAGPPGVSYFRGEREADGYPVDCLLYRDEDGQLIGVFNHFPLGVPNLERPGDGNLMVHPEHRRKGIARQLILECLRRGWATDNEGFRASPEGAAFIRELLDELGPHMKQSDT